MKQAVIKPLAQQDVREAVSFYETRVPDLGRRFRERLRHTIRTIRDHPQAWTEIEPGVRWALVPGFPYKVYFLQDEDPIPIIAVLHTARQPDFWQSRRPR